MEKPMLDPLPTWFQRAWLQLRSALFIGTVVGGVVIGAMKAYREAFPQQEPATAKQLNDARAATLTDFRAVADSVVRGALATYTDSLAAVRQNIEDSVARPVYQAILDLDRRTSRIERNLVAAGIAIEEQRQQSAAASAELLARVSDARSTDEIKALMGQMLAETEELKNQVQQLKSARNTKKQF